MPRYARWDLSQATEIVAEHAGVQGATIEIFHALMDRFGYVDRAIVPVVADRLNLSRAAGPSHHQGLPGRGVPVSRRAGDG